MNDEGGIKSAARGTAARAESESIEAPSKYLYLFGGLSARSPFGSQHFGDRLLPYIFSKYSIL